MMAGNDRMRHLILDSNAVPLMLALLTKDGCATVAAEPEMAREVVETLALVRRSHILVGD
jgi:hypothetical protein